MFRSHFVGFKPTLLIQNIILAL